MPCHSLVVREVAVDRRSRERAVELLFPSGKVVSSDRPSRTDCRIRVPVVVVAPLNVRMSEGRIEEAVRNRRIREVLVTDQEAAAISF